MLSSFPCTANTCYPSSMSKSFSTTKSTLVKMDVGRSVHHLSSSRRLTRGSRGEFFPAGSEAERRISFFAQSLTTSIPEPLSVDAMPTFTVLTPHYSEKVRFDICEGSQRVGSPTL